MTRDSLGTAVVKSRLRRDYQLAATHPALGRLDRLRVRRGLRLLEAADSPAEIAKLESRLDALRARLNAPKPSARESWRRTVSRVAKVTVVFLLVHCGDYLLTEGEVPALWEEVYRLLSALPVVWIDWP
jgi:hypothetical protein